MRQVAAGPLSPLDTVRWGRRLLAAGEPDLARRCLRLETALARIPLLRHGGYFYLIGGLKLDRN